MSKLMTDCANCPLRKMPLFIPFSPEDLAFMRSFKSAETQVDRNGIVLHEGERSPLLYTVLSGLGTRSMLLPDGRRQVINFVFPGDFIGLQSSLMGEMKHTVQATTPMVLCTFERARLWEVFRDQAERAYDLTWIAAVEEHFLGETIATLGQRDAMERLSWALLRMYRKLSAVGLMRDGSVPLPYRQQDMADALGLSLVHTNKTVARLRAEGLANWSGGRLSVPDPDRLARAAGQADHREEQRPIL
ncbi:Crp/Fnr family transcriptional regulator [Paracoccaceae bacterium Fryx2]|nr:Crp/Fnr family transcriptional regulator [Paracoccaceae bacterium Fryx2]